MASSNFSFSSPGVKIKEIDKSLQLQSPDEVSPVIFGQSRRGPAFQPIKVKSYEQFVEIFGEPQGGGQSGDVWRDGNYTAPFYGPYAAQSWLKNGNSVTFVRLLGSSNSEAGNTTGYSGWYAGAQNAPIADNGGGSYALFVFPSASAGTSVTGSLAAIFYSTDCSIRLSASAGRSTAMMAPSDSNGYFSISVCSGSLLSPTVLAENKCSLNANDPYFIRKVFNTNPQSTNSNLVDTTATTNLASAKYWLGETFENDYSKELFVNGVAYNSQSLWGVILNIYPQSTTDWADHKNVDAFSSIAKSGWIISQDLLSGSNSNFNPATQTRLFRFVDRIGGDWSQGHIKISLANIRQPQNLTEDAWATFDVIVRKIDDTDAAVKVLERFQDCNLNPSSEKYISKKIGNKFLSYDEASSRWKEEGDFDNKSKFIRIEMNPDLDISPDVSLCPFGCLGPLKLSTLTTTTNTAVGTWAYGSSSIGGVTVAASASTGFNTSSTNISSLCTYKLVWPSMKTRTSSSIDGLPTPKMAYWGAWTNSSLTSNQFNKAFVDLTREGNRGLNLHGAASGSQTSSTLEYSWTFSLDNIVENGTSNKVYYVSSVGKTVGSSVTANSGSRELLNRGINNFTTVLYGGSNGWNITESNPLANRVISASDPATIVNNYAFNTYKKAFDLVRDPEEVTANILVAPGLTHSGLTNRLINIAEDRQDCLFIMDVEKGFYPPHEKRQDQLQPASGEVAHGNKDAVISQVNTRGIDSTYVASYFPWIQIKDDNGQMVWVPPSIPALGAMAYTDKTQGPWFSPAGLNRGGLSQSVVGLYVISVAVKLNEKDRDDLQIVNVNPIAKFPKNGIAIWGQKTMTPKLTGLNRVNVRRLALYVKDKVGSVLSDFLFEPNLEETWNKAKSRVEPILADIKARLGVVDAKFILDSTTTTPDLIDQNIMYAKIILKPAKAIEYIAVDLVIVGSNEQV